MTSLLFQAISDDEGRLVVPPCFRVDAPPSVPSDGLGDLAIDLLDAAGKVLVSGRAALMQPCGVPTPAGRERQPVVTRLAQALLPYDPKARTLRVSQWGRTLYERSVEAEPPALKVRWPTAKLLTGPSVSIAWESGDDSVHALLQFSADDQIWQPLSLPTRAAQCEVDLGRLPGGKACRFRLMVSNGVLTTVQESKPFRLAPRGWIAMVLQPEAGQSIATGSPIDLVGQGFHLEEGRAEVAALHWHSSIDGPLGTGARRRVRLSPGRHHITLKVGDDAQRSVEVEVG
jgi:hypothetical protein